MTANDENKDTAESTTKKIEDLYKLIDGMDIAMFTTRRSDGQMVSRPMSTQEHTAGTDLWFVTDVESHKIDELATEPHVNLAYYNSKTREYVSVAGTAKISQDKNLIHGLYKPDWKAWFGDQGGARNGGPDDPRLALIVVTANSVEYFITNKPKVVMMFEVAKALVTGGMPNVGEERSISQQELNSSAARSVR